MAEDGGGGEADVGEVGGGFADAGEGTEGVVLGVGALEVVDEGVEAADALEVGGDGGVGGELEELLVGEVVGGGEGLEVEVVAQQCGEEGGVVGAQD